MFHVCVSLHLGGGCSKGCGGGGEHIKMITHRKTAAFMVFLYFLMFFFIEATSRLVIIHVGYLKVMFYLTFFLLNNGSCKL